MSRFLVVVVLSSLAVACSLSSSALLYDAGGDAPAPTDTAVGDARGPMDSATPSDSRTAGDTNTPDTRTRDDTSAPDTGTPDTSAPDTGAPDTGAPDTGTPDTGTPDTGTPDTAPPPLSCNDIFVSVPGYRYCSESASECLFYARLDKLASCDDVCSAAGQSCLGVRNNAFRTYCTETDAWSCDGDYGGVICRCTR